jgi:hypothetical protein
MQGPPTRKGSGSQSCDTVAKSRRWELDLQPDYDYPTGSGSAVFSNSSNTHISGGNITTIGRDNVNNITHNYNCDPQAAPFDVLKVLNSSELPNFRGIHEGILAKATDGTCLWFKEGAMLAAWRKSGKILWGIGIRELLLFLSRSVVLTIP